MRVDEKTKEVIQEWSLTNIKRWAASPKSFTLVGTSAGPPCLFPTGAPVVGSLTPAPLSAVAPWGIALPSSGKPLPVLALEAGTRVLSAYQRGSAWLPVPCSGSTLCPAVAGFWRLSGWLLLSADDGRGTDCPADCWLHRYHPQEGEVLLIAPLQKGVQNVPSSCLQTAFGRWYFWESWRQGRRTL